MNCETWPRKIRNKEQPTYINQTFKLNVISLKICGKISQLLNIFYILNKSKFHRWAFSLFFTFLTETISVGTKKEQHSKH